MKMTDEQIRIAIDNAVEEASKKHNLTAKEVLTIIADNLRGQMR